MPDFNVPKKEEVSEKNQLIFNKIEKGMGFVPNIYAFFTKSENALESYVEFSNRKTTFSKKEKEVINLVVSEYNGCNYCLSAHSLIARLNGFTTEEILKVRQGKVPLNNKLNALAKFTLEILKNRGKITNEQRAMFLDAGYDEAHLVDVAMTIGEKTISNLIYNMVKFDIDFPEAPNLVEKVV